MVRPVLSVCSFMSLSPVFVHIKSNLHNAFEIMKSFNAEIMPVINDDFSIVGLLNKKMLDEEFEKHHSFEVLKSKVVDDLSKDYTTPIVLYERMSVLEAYTIMKCLNVNGLPVADLPWEKKIVGYLWLDDIEHLVNDPLRKIPV